MAYTKLERIKYKKLFTESKMIDDNRYRRILLYTPEELSNNLIFEIHLRIKLFKCLYNKCYEYIKNVVKPNSISVIENYPELDKYSNNFKKHGYDFNDIKLQIFKDILADKNSFSKTYNDISLDKYKKINLFKSNSIMYCPRVDNTIQFNSKDIFTINVDANNASEPYISEYYAFIKKFDIYKMKYSMPSNFFFLEENSINIKILLEQNKEANDLQMKNISELIKNIKSDKKNYDITELSKKNLLDISTCFYLYDLSKKGIPESLIKEFTFEYLYKKYYSELENLKSYLQNIIDLTKRINNKIDIYINKNVIEREEKDLFINDIHLIIKQYTYVKNNWDNLITLNLKRVINKNIESYDNLQKKISMIYEKKQVKVAKASIKNNEERPETYYIDNYKDNHIEKIYYKSNLYFPLCKKYKYKEIEEYINIVNNILVDRKFLKEKRNKHKEIINFEISKVKEVYNLININLDTKISTLTTYINTIKGVVKNIQKNYKVRKN